MFDNQVFRPDSIPDSVPNISKQSKFSPLGFIRLHNMTNIKRLTVVVILILAASGAAYLKFRNTPEASKTSSEVISTSSVDINDGFDLPIKDKKGNLTDSKIKFTITKVDRTKSLIIKGQKANAVNGRIFLIVNLKLENPAKTSLSMRTRDFVRMLPEGTEDKLAPDIHNDPVEVQAISTKITRVGFTVDTNIKNFKLYVGEIESDKKEIGVNF